MEKTTVSLPLPCEDAAFQVEPISTRGVAASMFMWEVMPVTLPAPASGRVDQPGGEGQHGAVRLVAGTILGGCRYWAVTAIPRKCSVPAPGLLVRLEP
jgi:hypothetical protein